MLTTTPIKYTNNSEVLFDRLADLPFACWLDSGKPYSQYGRYDIITALPAKRIIAKHRQHTEIIHYLEAKHEVQKVEQTTEDPLHVLTQLLRSLKQIDSHHQLPFAGGAIGYFSYDLGKRYVPINNRSLSPPSSPEMDVGLYHWALIQDHQLKRSCLAFLPECQPQTKALVEERLNKALPEMTVSKTRTYSFTSNLSYQEYAHQIQQIHDYILAGDCYQVNFAQCFTSEFSGNSYQAYKELRPQMASPFSAYLAFDEQHILSLSPERFIKVEDQKVLTQPIKGTTPRHRLPDLDKQQANALMASEKDRAENLMIVDLLRNDLGKHCLPGSIKVDKLFDIESFPNVHHLVSSISGKLPESTHCLTLFRDCFPGGSITGAPKKRAMEIIEELENQARGIYCGSIGYINHLGDMDTNIAIRTLHINEGKATCWGGGGIVADSVAESEYQESIDKIEKLITALSQKY